MLPASALAALVQLQMSNLLALDQASATSGWAVFIDGELLEWGKIKAPQAELGERLVYIRQEIIKLIEKYSINEIGFEDIQLQNSVGNNVKTFKVLAAVFGVVSELCEELHIPYTIVSSNTWKSSLKIGGKTRPQQKKEAQLFVQNTYGIKATQDESDAICIGTHLIKDLKSAWA